MTDWNNLWRDYPNHRTLSQERWELEVKAVGDRLQSENKELGVTIIQQACKLEAIKTLCRRTVNRRIV